MMTIPSAEESGVILRVTVALSGGGGQSDWVIRNDDQNIFLDHIEYSLEHGIPHPKDVPFTGVHHHGTVHTHADAAPNAEVKITLATISEGWNILRLGAADFEWIHVVFLRDGNQARPHQYWLWGSEYATRRCACGRDRSVSAT